MSIKSLFEDIADAIREKSGSSDTYTPAEMPSAIRSIPSGSGTASGVSYDNTSSGLTASNVQDAIDELSGDVLTINSDLSELTVVDYDMANMVDLSGYDSVNNSYTFPSNGILHLGVGAVAGTNDVTYMLQNRGKTSYMTVSACGTGYRASNSINVYKGQHAYKYSADGTWYATFIPYITE